MTSVPTAPNDVGGVLVSVNAGVTTTGTEFVPAAEVTVLPERTKEADAELSTLPASISAWVGVYAAVAVHVSTSPGSRRG